MNRLLMKLIFGVAFLFVSVCCKAYDFECNGYYYTMLNESEVALARSGRYYPPADYSGVVTIPETIEFAGMEFTVTEIEYEAFINSAYIDKLIIPKTVKNIKEGEGGYGVGYSGLYSAWWNPYKRGVKQIEVDSENEYFKSQDGVLYNKKMTKLLAFPIEHHSTEFTIPESVTYIANGAFYGARKIQSIEMSDNVKHIGKLCFAGCVSLSRIRLSENVDSLLSGTFGMEDIPEKACGLTEIKLPSNLRYIASYVFWYSKIQSIEIPEKVCYIDKTAFWGCDKLYRIDVQEQNENYTSIDGVLFGKNLKKLLLLPQRESNEYIIPNGVDTIGCYSIQASNLNKLHIPASVSVIEERPFYFDMSNMIFLYMYSSTPPEIIKVVGENPHKIIDPFEDFSSHCFLYVPKGCVDVYKNYNIVYRRFKDVKEMSEETNIKLNSERDYNINIYNLSGMLIHKNYNINTSTNKITPGIYIVNNKKVLFK